MRGDRAGAAEAGRTDFNVCAADYDHRYRCGPVGVTELIGALVTESGAGRVLEAACGTGHWLRELPAVVKVGLDLSWNMLGQARRRKAASLLVQGDAEQLPFAAHSFDCILCIHGVHHFPSPARFIREARRLLRPGGTLAIIGMDPHQGTDQWYVYDYFAGTRQADLRRYPATGTLLRMMARQEFVGCAIREGAHLARDFQGQEVLRDPILHKNGVSQLTLLPEEEFAAGIKRLHAAIAAGKLRGREPIFHARIRLPAVVGFAPGL